MDSGADDPQQSAVNDSSTNQTAGSAVQNALGDSAQQNNDESNADGENKTPETPVKPKRFVN